MSRVIVKVPPANHSLVYCSSVVVLRYDSDALGDEVSRVKTNAKLPNSIMEMSASALIASTNPFGYS